MYGLERVPIAQPRQPDGLPMPSRTPPPPGLEGGSASVPGAGAGARLVMGLTTRALLEIGRLTLASGLR